MQKHLAQTNLGAAIPSVQKFRDAIGASGQFGVQTYRNVSATQAFSKALEKENVSIASAIKNRKLFNNVLKEQYQINRMMAVNYTQNATGGFTGDMIIPRDVPARITSFRAGLADASKGLVSYKTLIGEATQRVGLFSQILKANGNHISQWGRATQYAGLQISYGLTMPMLAIGAAAATGANELDKQLTRVTKVYDYTTNNIAEEQKKLRDDAKKTAQVAAESYGQMATDTLEIQASLAAVGVKGSELQQKTLQVSKAMMLGELNKQQAIDGTIALQSVYKMSTEDLTEAFNYMNAMENATSLSMEDFIEAIPRGAGTLREFGVGLKELGPLLVAMKNQGIDAAEGMTGLKSAAQRLAAPSKAAQSIFKDLTGQDLVPMIEKNQGKFIETLTDLGTAMKGLEPYARQQIITKVFGIYQSNKVNAVLDSLISKQGDVAGAYKVMAQSSEQWSQTADKEVDQLQNSISGKFARAVATLKLQIAEMGEPFLEVATTVISAVSAIIDKFNGLSSGQKKFLLIAGAVGALVGPVIMIAGAFANLFGHMLKGAATVGTLLTRFKLLNPEAKLQDVLAKQTSLSWYDEANAAAVLSRQMRVLTTEMNRLAKIQTGGFITSFTDPTSMVGTASPNLKQDKNGKWRRENGAFASKSEIAAQEAMVRAAADSKTIATNATVTESKWSKIGNHAQGLAIAGSMMGGMASDSGTLINNISNALLVASLIGPTVVKGLSKIKGVDALSGLFGGGTGGGKLSKSFDVIKTKGGAMTKSVVSGFAKIAPMLGAWGVGIAAVAYGYYQIRKHYDAIEKQQKNINESAKAWADILGVAYDEAGKVSEAQAKGVDDLDKKVQEFTKANKDAAKNIASFRDNSQDEKWQRAIAEGLKVKLHTGSTEAANEATRVALKIMGERLSKAEFQVAIKGKINFDSSPDVLQAQLDQYGRILQDEINKPKNKRELFSVKGELDQRSGTNVRSAAKEMWNVFQNTSDVAKKRVFTKIRQDTVKDFDQMWGDLGKKQKDSLKKAGLGDLNALLKVKPVNLYTELTKAGLSDDDADKMAKRVDAIRNFIRVWAEMNNLNPESATLGDIEKALDLDAIAADDAKSGLQDVESAQRSYMTALRDRVMVTKHDLPEAEKLAILNQYRLAAGLDAAKTSAQGFSDGIKHAAADTEDLTAATEDAAEKAQEMADAQKEVFQTTQDDMFSRAKEIADDQNQASLDAIQKRGDKALAILDTQSDALDKKWEDRKNKETAYYDSRIEKINKAIEAEETAEELRQKIFEAEKTRIERMSQLYSKNIDFNVALNTGNLDEAARVSNDVQSMQAGWMLGSAADASTQQSEARKKALQANADSLDKQKDARLKVLDEIENKEKAALEKSKQMTQEKTQAEIDGAKKRQEANQRALDLELRGLQASIPRNEKELREHQARLEAAYAKYGVNLKIKGNEWSGYVGKALQTNIGVAATNLRTKIQWQAIASDIANKMTQGAFGLNMAQFDKWIRTGEAPASGLKSNPGTAGTTTASGARAVTTSSGEVAMHGSHKGGLLLGSGDRTGYAPGSSMAHSEVNLLAKRGEYVVNDKATAKHLPLLNAINSGDDVRGGGSESPGLVGLMMGSIGGMMKNVIQTQISRAGSSMLSGGADGVLAEGSYGGVNVNATQAANASKILAQGRKMGASKRDLIIAIMTAMQESTLKNYANRNVPESMKLPHQAVGSDHDSVGLFQQRPSSGWGTVAQIMDPTYSAMKFFQKLLANGKRDSMSMGAAAQSVQHSAFPGAYTKWENLANAIVNSSSTFAMDQGGGTGGGNPGSGTFTPPPGHPRNTTQSERNKALSPLARSALGQIISKWPGVQPASYGGYVSGANYSYHRQWALDLMTDANNPAGKARGNAIASWAIQNAGKYGLAQILWNHRYTDGRGWTPTTGGTDPHTNHVHLSIGIPRGGTQIPGLATGGYTLNDGYAMLHKNEAVLTAPLTEKLTSGIERIDSGVSNAYNVTVNFTGAVNSQLDYETGIERAIEKVQAKQASRVGIRRTLK